MLAGFGLHVTQIKLFACFYFFLGSWNNYFSHIYSCTNAHINQTKRICPRFSIVIINTDQHMRFSYLSHRREANAQLILRIYANSSEPCVVHTITIELSCIIHIRVHTNKMSSEKLRRHNLIFIYEDRPVSREAQTDLDRCLVLGLSTSACRN